jgi:hypothetical protein
MCSASGKLDSEFPRRQESVEIERKAARWYSKANVDGEEQIDVGHPAGIDDGACAASTFLGRLKENEKLTGRVPQKRLKDMSHPKSYRDVAVMTACMHHEGGGGYPSLGCGPMIGGSLLDGKSIDIDTQTHCRPWPSAVEDRDAAGVAFARDRSAAHT